MGVLTDPK
jgi:hypothetical protein